jgi:hypothetical protein
LPNFFLSKSIIDFKAIHMYSETSLDPPALGPKYIAGLEGRLVSRDLFCNELLSRDLRNRPIFKEDRFSEGPV